MRKHAERRQHHPLRFLHRRWFHVWLVMVALSLALAIAMKATDNKAMEPAAFFYGAAAAPLAILVAIQDRTGIAARVPAVTLLTTFLVGGGVGLLLAGVFDAELIGKGDSPAIMAVGFIEEPAKLAVPVAIAVSGRYLDKRAGLALGLASATGFAILESMAYGFAGLGKHDDIFGSEAVLLFRGFSDPFGHQVWTGMVCAVAFGVWEQRGRVVITQPVVGAFLAAAVLHSANDSVLSLGPDWLRFAWIPVAIISLRLFRRTTRDLTITQA